MLHIDDSGTGVAHIKVLIQRQGTLKLKVEVNGNNF